MAFTRVVSQDQWSSLTVSHEILQKIRILFWQDPSCNETLRALSLERKICPVIEVWRRIR